MNIALTRAQDRAKRVASAIVQVITAKQKITTTELHEQLVVMLTDEFLNAQLSIISEICTEMQTTDRPLSVADVGGKNDTA